MKHEGAGPRSRLLATTTGLLAGRGLIGIVWADASLVVLESVGQLSDSIPVGRPLMESMVMLIGAESELAALRTRPGVELVIPEVQVVPIRGSGVRLNVTVFWSDAIGCYVLCLTPASNRSEADVRLAAEVRARAMAEAEARETSRMLAAANSELAAINRDLEAFAYVVSHDLKAPLRALRYAATDAGEAIDAGDAKGVLDRLAAIRTQTRRMAAMLDGLLAFARSGGVPQAVETVDTGGLALEVVGSIPRPETLRIELEGDWPTFRTPAEPLDIVLRNLVDNAVKHHDTGRGRIRLISTSTPAGKDGRYWRFSVADDGPGIAEEWQTAIFEPFRRLDDDVDGAGIGLALVKKTVERIGGTVTVRSRPGLARGTTFDVAWPLSTAE